MADLEWMNRAACRPHVNAGHDWWFGDQDERDLAVKVCNGCPVREHCLDYAVGPGRLYGQAVAGGLGPGQLTHEARRRGLIRHGTSAGYRLDGCRCDHCRQWMSDAAADSREAAHA
jgi:hypothetical protein